MRNRVRVLGPQSGESLMGIGLAMFLMVLFSLLSLNTFIAGRTNNFDVNAATEAYLLGNQLLQQQTEYGCGTATSSQIVNGAPTPVTQGEVTVTPNERNSLQSISSRCSYGYSSSVNGGQVYGALGTAETCSNATTTSTGYLSDTPWVCINYGGYYYQAMIQNTWVTAGAGTAQGTSPSNSAYGCNSTSMVYPSGINTTVTLAWWVSGIEYHRTFSSYGPLPKDTPASYVQGDGAIVLCSIPNGQYAAAEMTVSYVNSSGASSSYKIIKYPSSNGDVWFPYIPTGSANQTSVDITCVQSDGATPLATFSVAVMPNQITNSTKCE